MTLLQKIPQTGDVVEAEGKRIRILEMLGRRISKVKLEEIQEPPAGSHETP
jgi:CBS domain containing-hemolysin-like protein